MISLEKSEVDGSETVNLFTFLLLSTAVTQNIKRVSNDTSYLTVVKLVTRIICVHESPSVYH